MRYEVPLEDPRVESFRLVRPERWARRLSRWLVALLLLGAVVLALVPWQQTAYGEGQVVARSPTERQARIDAPVDGWAEEWFVQEGTRVREGDPIVRLADNDPQLLVRLRAEREATRARLDAAERALATARRNVERQRSLLGQGLSSRRQLEESQLKEADAQKEVAGARAELARIETRLAQQGQQLVRAPRDGIILRRTPGAGSVFVKRGDELAVLVPETESQAVELWMDGNELPLLSPGREVRLQFEGWPAVQLSGWPSAAVGTFAGRVAVIDPAPAATPGKFRILVAPAPDEPWPPPERLRQGVRAHGWVLLGTVPLGYELWRQFNDFPPSLPPEEEKGRTGPAPKTGGK